MKHLRLSDCVGFMHNITALKGHQKEPFINYQLRFNVQGVDESFFSFKTNTIHIDFVLLIVFIKYGDIEIRPLKFIFSVSLRIERCEYFFVNSTLAQQAQKNQKISDAIFKI